MPRYFLAIFLAFASQILADVINLTEDDFASHVDGSTNVLVEFYAPWCGHCKNLAPEWKIAGETFQATDDIKITAVDATANSKLASKFGIKGYPTIKFFPKGSTSPEDYDGGRTADSIVQWVNNKVGTSRKVKAIPSAVTALSEEDFDAQVLGSKAALVEFYAPWCGHCKELAPKYEKLAKAFAGENSVLIAKVDATEWGELANRFDVTGYPTLKFFPANSDVPEFYNGQRELEALVDFINEKTGLQRNSDGSLKASAGRVAAIDEVIKTADYNTDAALVEAVKKAAEGLEGADVAYGKIYVAVAEKAAAKGGQEYIVKEQARLAGMISKGNIKPESKANFQYRQNILSAFEKVAVEGEYVPAANDEL